MFFQEPPGRPDLFASDDPLQALLRQRLPQALQETVWRDFEALGQATAGELWDLMMQAEAESGAGALELLTTQRLRSRRSH